MLTHYAYLNNESSFNMTITNKYRYALRTFGHLWARGGKTFLKLSILS